MTTMSVSRGTTIAIAVLLVIAVCGSGVHTAIAQPHEAYDMSDHPLFSGFPGLDGLTVRFFMIGDHDDGQMMHDGEERDDFGVYTRGDVEPGSPDEAAEALHQRMPGYPMMMGDEEEAQDTHPALSLIHRLVTRLHSIHRFEDDDEVDQRPREVPHETRSDSEEVDAYDMTNEEEHEAEPLPEDDEEQPEQTSRAEHGMRMFFDHMRSIISRIHEEHGIHDGAANGPADGEYMPDDDEAAYTDAEAQEGDVVEEVEADVVSEGDEAWSPADGAARKQHPQPHHQHRMIGRSEADERVVYVDRDAEHAERRSQMGHAVKRLNRGHEEVLLRPCFPDMMRLCSRSQTAEETIGCLIDKVELVSGECTAALSAVFDSLDTLPEGHDASAGAAAGAAAAAAAAVAAAAAPRPTPAKGQLAGGSDLSICSATHERLCSGTETGFLDVLACLAARGTELRESKIDADVKCRAAIVTSPSFYCAADVLRECPTLHGAGSDRRPAMVSCLRSAASAGRVGESCRLALRRLALPETHGEEDETSTNVGESAVGASSMTEKERKFAAVSPAFAPAHMGGPVGEPMLGGLAGVALLGIGLVLVSVIKLRTMRKRQRAAAPRSRAAAAPSVLIYRGPVAAVDMSTYESPMSSAV